MKEMIYGLPVVALRGTSILPEMIVHFDAFRQSGGSGNAERTESIFGDTERS